METGYRDFIEKQKDIFYLIGQRLAQAVSEAAVLKKQKYRQNAQNTFCNKREEGGGTGLSKNFESVSGKGEKTEEAGEKEEKVSISEIFQMEWK